MQRLPFTKSPINQERPKLLPRRSLVTPTRSITCAEPSPLRSSSQANVIPNPDSISAGIIISNENANNTSSSASSSTAPFGNNGNKVFHLTELLQQVLQFLQQTSTEESAKFASDDTSEELPSITGNSSDENENEATIMYVIQ